MCGFAGILRSGRSAGAGVDAEVEQAVQQMIQCLRRRGPDGTGLFVNPKVALGHCRLSILDLSEAGAQPMVRQEGGVVVVYNGECYNFRELRQELAGKGREFRSQSDTEVVLQMYEAWGPDGLKRLEGIFALAIWDRRRDRLVLMRDRLGIKPLYYGTSRFGLAFGSEIKAVKAAGGVDLGLDEQSFSEYLWFGNTFDERTFYGGVRSLRPGHWLIVEGAEERIEPWWKLEDWLVDVPTGVTESDAATELRDRIDVAVTRQLISDVPVGIFLSGGVDSSTIAAAAVQAGGSSPVSFAAGFDFAGGVDELSKARGVATQLGLEHHELRISGVDLASTLKQLARAHDEPFADAANIPLYLMCRELSGRIKVVLQGDGGDELFAGYRRYALLQNARWWKRCPTALVPVLRSGGAYGQRLGRLLDAMAQPDPAVRMALLLTMETRFEPPERLLMKERQVSLRNSTDPFLAYRGAAERFQTEDPVQQMLLTDLTVQLPSQFLCKVDRATMAASVEARVPLLDEQVVRLAVQLPSSWKTRGTQKKLILRNSQRTRLPGSVLDAPKSGFGVPYSFWLRTALREFAAERILDRSFRETFAVDEERLEQSWNEHVQRKRDHGFLLWKFFQMALWKECCQP